MAAFARMCKFESCSGHLELWRSLKRSPFLFLMNGHCNWYQPFSRFEGGIGATANDRPPKSHRMLAAFAAVLNRVAEKDELLKDGVVYFPMARPVIKIK